MAGLLGPSRDPETRNAAIRTAIVKRSWVLCNCCRNAAETQEHRDPKRETQREAANWGSGVRPWPPEHGAMRETSHETRLETQPSESRDSKRETHGTHTQRFETQTQNALKRAIRAT